MYTCKEISDLPDDILRYILKFIPTKRLIFINSTYYSLYHYLLKNMIPTYESYVRDMIRRDCDFVFEKIIRENIDIWIKNKKYIYKDMTFNNYIYFIIYYCIENNSDNCKKLIIDYLNKHDLCKNLHKKKVVKYIKWNN